MRERLASLNPTASHQKMADRACLRHTNAVLEPDAMKMLAALQERGEEMEDRLEGVIARE